METTIIIRTKNESTWIGECLARLKEQTYRNFDILIVDSGSTDDTKTIAKRFQARVLTIPEKDFSYPYASNYGCKHARGKKYFVFLSGHSLPLSKTWLEEGMEHFSNSDVAGVYGGVQALPHSGLWEWLFFNPIVGGISRKLHKKEMITKVKMGVLGCTNAIIRRDLWEQYPFDERYGNGGEDTAWARHWLEKGYIFVKDSHFSVAHSHGLGLWGLIKQWHHWKSNTTPQPFHAKNLSYRKNS